MLIGTHNSATGLPSADWKSKLVVPFARTQTKSLIEQWRNGCRYFDLRVRKTQRGWVFAHGLWESKYPVCKYLDRLNRLAATDNELTYVSITYEGEATDDFLDRVENWRRNYLHLIPTTIAQKRPYETFLTYVYQPVKQGFIVLDWSSLHTLLPIPWLWDRLKSRPHVFNDYVYTLCDFM